MFDSVCKILNRAAETTLFKSVLVMLFIFSALDIYFPLPEMKPYSRVVEARDGTLMNAYLSPDDKWRLGVELDELTPELITAIIQKEDKWFYWHPGFNPVSIVRAFFSNLFSGEIVSGASTITMQLARLMEPADRTYLNKIAEIFRAVQLELTYSKDELLEMYFSLLPYGGNIEGVKSAAYIFYNRPPDKLSLAQAVTLAVIPNDPNRLRLDKTVQETREFRDDWLRYFMKDGVFSKGAISDALEEPVYQQRYEMPELAPHFSYYVSERFEGDRLQTTLDLNIQKSAEDLLENHVNRIRGKGITQGALIVVENRTMEVKAYCGSVDFHDKRNSGEVNGVTSVRSPGSTLKPILYTVAFDQGMITPMLHLLDIPTDYGGYEPENFDEKFNGSVTVNYALVNSLNVPAVRLLHNYGTAQFIDFLAGSGFSEIARDRKKLGLSVILGGCGTRLEQLVRFYSAFANEGYLYHLNYLKESEKEEPLKLFSAEAVWLTSEILSGNERPDIPEDFLDDSRHPKIAWKTGTSYGKRDAWCIGYNPDYTIGVWIGNFDGEGSPHLVGAETATPLLFDLFNSINYDPQNRWFEKPEKIKRRRVCKETGLVLSEKCDKSIYDYYIDEVSPSTVCNLMKPVYVNSAGNLQYCTECLPEKGYKVKYYRIFEPELTMWFERINYLYEKPPVHNPECFAKYTSTGPVILSPSGSYEYYVEENTESSILLQAASDPRVTRHYWYINGDFYSEAEPGEKIFFEPVQGKTTVTCIDDKGRENSVNIRVKYY